jgi:hypothetical protein
MEEEAELPGLMEVAVEAAGDVNQPVYQKRSFL